MPETIMTAFFSSVAATAIIVFLGKTWIQNRIKASIEHEYKKQFELFTRELDRKEKIELVAELIGEYMKTPVSEIMQREQRLLLNKLSFKATLWLPADLAIELSKRLQNQPDAKSPFDLVLMARKALLNDQSLKPEHVTIWSLEKELRPDPILHLKK